MATYLFPGQGSQRKGMGKGLFEAFPELTSEVDEILGYSIRDLCLKDPKQKLVQTQYTQPALYVVNALSYQQKLKEVDQAPDFVAGHSLGEYNALQASGAISFADGLKLVQKRGELMSQAPEGAMAAIVGLKADAVKEVLQNEGLDGIDIANDNAPTQIVISGPPEDLSKSQVAFEASGGMFIPLNTSGAFHSRYMADAKTEFGEFLKDFKFDKLKIPVIANLSAQPYKNIQIKKNLREQITGTVQWTRSIQYLLEQGETEFEELGVGDVLAKLVTKIRKDSPVIVEAAVDLAKTKANTEPARPEAEVELASVEAATEVAVEPEPIAVESKPATSKPSSSANTAAAAKASHAERMAADRKRVEEWNQTYPVGMKVTVDGYEGMMETRTEAMLIFGHRAAIYLKDYNGYFHLVDVSPIKEGAAAV